MRNQNSRATIDIFKIIILYKNKFIIYYSNDPLTFYYPPIFIIFYREQNSYFNKIPFHASSLSWINLSIFSHIYVIIIILVILINYNTNISLLYFFLGVAIKF